MSKPVIPFVGVLLQPGLERTEIIEFVTRSTGFQLQTETELISFDHTDYYKEEMGPDLNRFWMSFQDPWTERDLADQKKNFMELETLIQNEHKADGRTVNLDPGYLRENQVVLASTKYVAHRLCIDQNMYAEVTLLYKNGTFQRLDWTYPDYTSETAISFFETLRNRYVTEFLI